MKSFSYSELDMLAGEVLPERAVLSTLLVGGGENENGNLNFNHNNGGGHHGGGTTAVVPNCQAINNNPQGGLVGALGLSSNNPTSSFTCAGSTVVSGH
ncbi:hypothetical protein OHR68_27060 [Spirillospora sp. NBC_00431]